MEIMKNVQEALQPVKRIMYGGCWKQNMCIQWTHSISNGQQIMVKFY